MEGLTTLVWMLLGLVVRFGLPVLMTALVIVGLRKLDETWQSSARSPGWRWPGSRSKIAAAGTKRAVLKSNASSARPTTARKCPAGRFSGMTTAR